MTGPPPADDPRHWFVTLTLGGDPVEPLLVRSALVRLADRWPLLQSMRFAGDAAELQFWDEGGSMLEVASLALRLWGDARAGAGLPRWEVIGLEVVERPLRERRLAGDAPHFETHLMPTYGAEPR